MKIRVFEINNTVREETLEQIDIDNIKKVFDKIFEPKNTDHLKISCHANEDSILERYNTEAQTTFNLKTFANELHNAEKKQDGTRNKQITEGYLFIKQETNRLVLLKLENIEVIDKEKNYEMRKSFSTEANYYKGCIFNQNNTKNITVIDKNKAIAKYWRENFLDLSLNRDELQNSTELIDLLESNYLFTNSIQTQGNFENIKKFTENFIFDNTTFDKIVLGNELRTNKLISYTNLNDIYSEESKVLDAEFNISKKAIRDKYKKTIQISEDTKIYTDNYSRLYSRQGIRFEDGKIILSVNDNFIDLLPEELIDEN